VLDVGETSSPVRVGSFSGASGPTGLAASGTHLYLADGINGLLSVQLSPKLLVAEPLLSPESVTLRWTGGAGTILQQAFALGSSSWKDLANTDGQSRIQVPRTAPLQFFRAIQR